MDNLNLQNSYLGRLKNENILLSLYLINGIKLVGYIKDFDENVLLLNDNNSSHEQLIYKHAISSIVPKN